MECISQAVKIANGIFGTSTPCCFCWVLHLQIQTVGLVSGTIKPGAYPLSCGLNKFPCVSTGIYFVKFSLA